MVEIEHRDAIGEARHRGGEIAPVSESPFARILEELRVSLPVIKRSMARSLLKSVPMAAILRNEPLRPVASITFVKVPSLLLRHSTLEDKVRSDCVRANDTVGTFHRLIRTFSYDAGLGNVQIQVSIVVVIDKGRAERHDPPASAAGTPATISPGGTFSRSFLWRFPEPLLHS